MSELILLTGPMRAGKTCRLFSMLELAKRQGHRTLLLGSTVDSVSPPGTVKAHTGRQMEATIVDRLDSVDVSRLDQVFINECQFFPDPETIVAWLDAYPSLKVVACGLDADYRREPFGSWISLLVPHATEVTKLVGMCSNCNMKKALFTHKTSGSFARVDLAGTYYSLCRKCYLQQAR